MSCNKVNIVAEGEIHLFLVRSFRVYQELHACRIALDFRGLTNITKRSRCFFVCIWRVVNRFCSKQVQRFERC